ncbi:MAG: YABBY transcription factor [Rickettsiales bacterium]|jgi:hypothetical protein|nr:YABBY transcription factor [Rickettsiales bacterium]
MPKKKQESLPQTTILDLTNCMSDQKVVDDLGKMDTMLKQLVVEADNPALIELDKLYKENSELKIDDPRVKKISSQLEKQLESFDKTSSLNLEPSDNITDYSLNYGGSTSGIPKHLAFVVQALNNNHNLDEVMKGYKYNGTQRIGMIGRMQTQFNKDITRTPFIIMDQHGKVIEEDLSKTIPRELNLTASIESDYSHISSKRSNLFSDSNITNEEDYEKRYTDCLKEKTGMTDKEYDLMSKNYTQRSMVGVGSAFAASAGCKTPNQTKRKNILHVHVDDNGNRELKSMEYQERIVSNKIGPDGMPIIDDDTNKPIQTPLFDISYKLSPNHGTPQRTVTIQELSPEGRVQLPTSLQSKTIAAPRKHQNEIAEKKAIDKIILQAITREDSELANDFIGTQHNIEKKLERSTLLSLCQGALTLNEENKNKVIEGFIKKEIKQIKANNPEFSAKEIANQAEETIITLIVPQGISPDLSKDFNKKLTSYIETESTTKLSAIVNLIKKCMGNSPEKKQQKLISGMRSQLQKGTPLSNNTVRRSPSMQKSTLVRQ